MRALLAIAASLCALPAALCSSDLTGRAYHPVLDVAHRHLVGPWTLDMTVDCAMRNLTWSYALALQPARAPLADVFDALRLAPDCNLTRPAAVPYAGAAAQQPSPQTAARLAAAAATYYADAVSGVDDASRSGSASQPFASVAFAVARARAGARPAAVLLTDAAPFFLPAPLLLGPADDGLTLAAAPGARTQPLLSAGAPLRGLAWSRVGAAPGSGVYGTPVMTIWACNVSAAASPPPRLPFDQLFGGATPPTPLGRRATRARFPNGNPELDVVPNGYTRANATHGWKPPPPFANDLVQQNPLATPLARRACAAARAPCQPGGDSGGGPPWAIFCCFFWGWNSTAVNFTSGSFWAAQPGPPGGATAQMPGGLLAGPDTLPRLAGWAEPERALVHAFHGSYWGNWIWQLQAVDAATGDVAFSRGGWQEARGAGEGDYLYYENLRAELDWAGEWFLDGQTLLYVANGTAAPPADGWVAAQHDNVVSVLGDAGVPARGVLLAGLALAHTATTFLQPFTVPSGGDMSFHDGGALRLSGTEGCAARGCSFRNLGGSGVMISGYNLEPAVDGCDFLHIGESAIYAMGLTGDRQDNLDGDVPTRPSITGNLASEFGLYVKQSGFYYQGMTANATVSGNVFFNGPRAGINFNDGFAGGHTVSRNVGFNLVRETSDHGVFNSWDRNTYRAHAWDPSNLETLPITMELNLFVCNYRALFPIDNDDGSNAYTQTRNLLLWGGAKNLMGYNKAFINNSFVYVDYSPIATPAVRALRLPLGEGTPAMRAKYGDGLSSGNGYGNCASSVAPWPSARLGLADQFRNNTCIASSSAKFFNWYNPCNDSDPTDGSMWLMSGNRYMSADGSYQNRCNRSDWTLADAQAVGVDIGSVNGTLPSLQQLLDMAHALLQF